ncbi:hypothetical protein OCH239_17840 [Roseivivax halodurans JCM 10272]|uniref:Uncharacterized protein n=1 Tax=Roseivivax halodurans JCM 10272 TaxID=1449350 RepID=X7EJ13_9RHOB|nr:DUF892 family protein [Roseivivax halodurans]ETX15148.1 hypothetical protein OCH239_17840 [Roseivivax halodurans JCM 10272]
MKDLGDLFTYILGDMYCAEHQILTAMPTMSGKASDDDLRAALEQLRRDTQAQIDVLTEVFATLGIAAKPGLCPAIGSILVESGLFMSEAAKCETRDAGLIAAAQTLGHYKIARYGTLIAWADELGKSDIAEQLRANLAREHAADAKLSKLGQTEVNKEAA